MAGKLDRKMSSGEIRNGLEDNIKKYFIQILCVNADRIKLEYKSYRNDQQDATLQEKLLLHCSLTAQHVSKDIIAHHQELLNYNYSF